jgi:hypothetical protein
VAHAQQSSGEDKSVRVTCYLLCALPFAILMGLLLYTMFCCDKLIESLARRDASVDAARFSQKLLKAAEPSRKDTDRLAVGFVPGGRRLIAPRPCPRFLQADAELPTNSAAVRVVLIFA